MENGVFFAQPLQVPARYEAEGSIEEQVVFALADLGEGTAVEVAEHWLALDPGLSLETCRTRSEQVLADLHEKGLVNASEGPPLRYNLVKETRPHRGRVEDI